MNLVTSDRPHPHPGPKPGPGPQPAPGPAPAPGDSNKVTPIVAAAALMTVLGAAPGSASALGRDHLTVSPPRLLSGTLIRSANDNNRYLLTGSYGGKPIWIHIDQEGGKGNPISVSATNDNPVHLFIQPTTAGGLPGFAVKGQLGSPLVDLNIGPLIGNPTTFEVRGRVGGAPAYLQMPGNLFPSAQYHMLGRVGNNNVVMDLSETNNNGSTFAISGGSQD